MEIILASASPRRKEILQNTKLKFEIQKSEIEEAVFEEESPESMVVRLAYEKAFDVAQKNREKLVIGADTIVVLGDEVLGNYVNIKVVKNKVAPPFKYAKVQIMYGKGISHTDELVSLAVDYDIIMKSGSWFSYKDEKIGQGKEACKKFIESHLDIQEEIEAKIREKMVEGD